MDHTPRPTRRTAGVIAIAALAVAIPAHPGSAAETCESASAALVASLVAGARACLTQDVPKGRSCTRRNRPIDRRAQLVAELCPAGTVERLACSARAAIVSAGLPYAALAGAGFALVCTTAACGNGVTEPPEQCDDGNVANGDGCSAVCQFEAAVCTEVCAGIPPVSGTAIRAERVVAGLSRPVFVTAPPRDTTRLFIVEQGGRIRIVKFGTLLPTPFLDISALVSGASEQGLLGLAFHPRYADTGRFYINYTDTAGTTVVAEYRVSANPDVADPASRQVVLEIPQPFANHNGGQVTFGPDGFLYVATGDGGSGGDPLENAENIESLLGKILRLDVNGGPPYAIPPTNPFAGPTPGRDEIWAYGLRNPWRFSFDRLTGDLWIADVGQARREEVNWRPGGGPGGENYGWDVLEGSLCYEPSSGCDPTGTVLPVLEYSHSLGCSVTGGYVYRGCRMPDLAGTYFFGDFCGGWVRSFRLVGGVVTDLQDRTAELEAGGVDLDLISSFGEDARGELYVVDHGGEVFRIVPAP